MRTCIKCGKDFYGFAELCPKCNLEVIECSEPRYSVEELEKILVSPEWRTYCYEGNWDRCDRTILCQFLKDTKKVKEILDE